MNIPTFRTVAIAAHILWPLTVLSVGLVCGGPAWLCAGWAFCTLPWWGTVSEPALSLESFRAAGRWTQAGVIAIGIIYVAVNIRILGWAAGWWTP